MSHFQDLKESHENKTHHNGHKLEYLFMLFLGGMTESHLAASCFSYYKTVIQISKFAW